MIRIDAKNPTALLKKILDAIGEQQSADGRDIYTWVLDEDGHLRHTGDGEQWFDRGFMRPVVRRQAVEFYFRCGSEKVRGAYGVLNGRLLTLLINHFSADVQQATFEDLR